MAIAQTTMTSTVTVPDALAIEGSKAWSHAEGTSGSGVGLMKMLIEEFQTGVTLPAQFNNTVVVDGFLGSKTTVTSLTSAATVTYTAAQIVGGMISDTISEACAATTDTAAAIIAAIDNCQVGTSFLFTLKNAAASAISITLGGGTDVTIVGTATVAQNNTKIWQVVVTSSTAVSFYSLGTLVH